MLTSAMRDTWIRRIKRTNNSRDDLGGQLNSGHVPGIKVRTGANKAIFIIFSGDVETVCLLTHDAVPEMEDNHNM